VGLREELSALKNQFEAGAPDAMRLVQEAIEGWRGSALVDNVLRVGDRAPALALPDAFGQIVRSEDLLAKGPLVLSFFRGAW
jgi:hypothetical protein